MAKQREPDSKRKTKKRFKKKQSCETLPVEGKACSQTCVDCSEERCESKLIGARELQSDCIAKVGDLPPKVDMVVKPTCAAGLGKFDESLPHCFCYTMRSLLLNNLIWIWAALVVTPVVLVAASPQMLETPTNGGGLAILILVCINIVLCSSWLFPLSAKHRCSFASRFLFGHYRPVWTSEEMDLDSYNSCLFGYHPHGVIPFAVFSTLSVPPLQNCCLLFSSVVCALPIYRFFLLLTGGIIPVSKKNVIALLKDGCKAMIVVGGVREMHLARPFRKDIGMYVGHKGFIRLAIQHGRNLAAILNFEENDMLAGCCPACERMAYRKCKLEGLPFWRNWLGIPVSNRLQVHLAISRVIQVQQEDNPSTETIDRVHKEYYDELRRLFESRKEEFGHGDRRLLFYDRDDLEAIYSEGYVEPWLHVPQQWPPMCKTITPVDET